MAAKQHVSSVKHAPHPCNITGRESGISLDKMEGQMGHLGNIAGGLVMIGDLHALHSRCAAHNRSYRCSGFVRRRLLSMNAPISLTFICARVEGGVSHKGCADESECTLSSTVSRPLCAFPGLSSCFRFHGVNRQEQEGRYRSRRFGTVDSWSTIKTQHKRSSAKVDSAQKVQRT